MANEHDDIPDLGESFENELDEALGSMNLASLMDTDLPSGGAAQAEGVRRGRVVSIQGDDIFIDLGGKSQGVLPTSQFRDGKLPAEGDVIDVTVERYDPDDGLLLLSREGAVRAATWTGLHSGQIVEGRVTGHNKGGLELDVNGIRAFMPISQVDRFRVEHLAPYVNQRFSCEVVEVNRGEQSIVVSRRAVLEREAAETRQRTFDALVEGQIVAGVVKTIMPYGAFVDIGGVDGLLHVRDMGFGRVEDPASVVREGQTLQVMVLRIDRDERKIALGLKQTMADPWDGAEAKWPVDTLVTGRVTRLMDFGAFVELESGVEGLVPIGEMTYERRIAHPKEIVSAGEVVKVRVLNVDLARRRIGLSIKRAGDDPWMGASMRWPVDSIVEGVVRRTADFGAFVELTPGVEGLVHISELSDAHVRTVADAVRVGDAVKAKVISVDEDARRMSLSIKQAAYSPARDADVPDAAAPAPRKRKKPLKGGLDW